MEYQEKLRLAKEALNSNSYDKKTIEYIFPELKESEDERIREAIEEAICCYWDDDTQAKTDCLAWLEKQKTVGWREEDKKVMVMTGIEKIKAEIERQIKEECPLDTYEGRCKSCWANTLLTFINSLIEEQQQEPKIKGWVARNRPNTSPNLQFFYERPIRRDNGYGDKFWHSPTPWSKSISISQKLFPYLKWEDEPIEVELMISEIVKNAK